MSMVYSGKFKHRNKYGKKKKEKIFSVRLFGPEVEIIVYNTIYLSIYTNIWPMAIRPKTLKTNGRNVTCAAILIGHSKPMQNTKFNLFCSFGTKCERTETGN